MDKKTLYEATKERKSAGNALGQSWGLLNCRAVNEVMEQVWKSPYRNDILPCGQIHDASYYFVKDDINMGTISKLGQDYYCNILDWTRESSSK